jgi:hypothetical protein
MLYFKSLWLLLGVGVIYASGLNQDSGARTLQLEASNLRGTVASLRGAVLDLTERLAALEEMVHQPQIVKDPGHNHTVQNVLPLFPYTYVQIYGKTPQTYEVKPICTKYTANQTTLYATCQKLIKQTCDGTQYAVCIYGANATHFAKGRSYCAGGVAPGQPEYGYVHCYTGGYVLRTATSRTGIVVEG